MAALIVQPVKERCLLLAGSRLRHLTSRRRPGGDGCAFTDSDW
jgi:hypothetical protein